MRALKLQLTIGTLLLGAACSDASDQNEHDQEHSAQAGTGGASEEKHANATETSKTTSAASADADVEVSEKSFECIKNWPQVRSFYVTNLLGNTDASLAVAKNTEGGKYPVGTLIQLVPNEAMVKRKAGFSADTADWEFFFLKPSAEGTEIVSRGTKDVMNSFGGNCFSCHMAAKPQFDFVCEQDHGCAPLPVSASVITDAQNGDPRCSK